jgi:post-segregation antitoxin (ccd killing protein)
MHLMTRVTIPDRLAGEARKRGLDLEALILDVLAEKLSRDPAEELWNRLEVAEHMIRRAREELDKGDPVEASEKIYKAVEEAVKVLARLHGLEECRRARDEGGWWSRLLAWAARRLAVITGDDLVVEAWANAFDLHVHGFHEHAYGVEEVEAAIPVVERLVKKAREELEAVRANPA